MMNDSIEISVLTTSEGADLISDTLTDLTGEGVCVSDKRDVLEVLSSKTNWDYVEGGVLVDTDDVVVKGFCKIEDKEKILSQLEERIAYLKSEDFGIDYGTLEVQVKEVCTKNWNEEWRKFYKTVELKKIAIVPDWLDYDGDKAVVKLEPGMAFGTGEHASTRLCLSLLEELDLVDKKVVDVGTGSGILGIASSKLGAKSVYMTDIDQKAVEVAKENVEKNKVEHNCVVEVADLSDELDCDIVIANLTADILLRLLDRLKKAVKKGVKLVASGIIAERLDEVLSSYESAGFKTEKVLSEDDWRAVYMVF
ncbi:MAG: 50S ribosomal protein L11 methyltransferase [Clostridia bacterium]|nr:50S ribosomal protein L11 methyltransferase [Clostridia bacterium]